MAIVYTKFLEMLKERNISIYQLKTDKVIGTATIDKLRKNRSSSRSLRTTSTISYLSPISTI